ncbi:hypothetical protein ACFLZ6_01245, partial [Nanoarchaeota archaeon]
MALEALLLNDRSAVKEKVSQLLEEDAEGFEALNEYFKEGRLNKGQRNRVYAALAGMGLDIEWRNVVKKFVRAIAGVPPVGKPPKNLPKPRFIHGRIKNKDLDPTALAQDLDPVDAHLLYFVDFLPKDQVVGRIRMIQAIAAEAAALSFSDKTYESFSEQGSVLLAQGDSVESFLFDDTSNLAKVGDACRAFYDRMYEACGGLPILSGESFEEEFQKNFDKKFDLWFEGRMALIAGDYDKAVSQAEKSLKVDPEYKAAIALKREARSRLGPPSLPEYECGIAAELFMNSFENKKLLGLVGLLSSKQELKMLKVVDSYVSRLRNDKSQMGLVDFMLNPLPLFEQRRLDASFDVWRHIQS